MQRRRVGTISMAILLIGFGILIFISQINKVSAVELGMKFWPAILFVIGGEILWYSYRYKGEDITIKYDIFSIFMVLVIVGINLLIYGLVETGVMNRINMMISSETFRYEIPYKQWDIDDGINRIVIDPPNYTNLTIRAREENKIIFTGALDITADREEKAKELLNDEYIRTNRSGDTLYISLAGRQGHGDGINSVYPRHFTLIIPGNREVEISGGNDLQLLLENVDRNWVIDSANKTRIRLDKSIDAKIITSVDNRDQLKGNVQWNISGNNGEGDSRVKGELVYGEGNNNINIFNSHEVVVDEVE
ncbi:MAG: hypothetical protein GXY88_06350 [Tissierellia bacterium]|nr:hypothetical protein [Tissierellia bacterium]